MGLGETEPAPKGSGEMELAPKGSGEMELTPHKTARVIVKCRLSWL